MWTQVHNTYTEIKPVLDKAKDGVTIICYSQGILYTNRFLYCISPSPSLPFPLLSLPHSLSLTHALSHSHTLFLSLISRWSNM